MEIIRLPIGNLVMMFLFYIISHAAIGIMHNKKKKELSGLSNNTELREQVKVLDIVFKWYPAAILIIYIIMLSK